VCRRVSYCGLARLGVADQFVVLDNKKPAIVEANAALTRRFQNEALPGIG
jgi:hypothetical protein